MKVLKPHRLALLQRVVQHQGRSTLVVSVITYLPMAEPRALLMEVALHKQVGEVVFGGLLDEGYPKAHGEVLVSGSACAQGGGSVTGVMTRLRVVRNAETLVDKKLAVVGDRYWAGSRPTEPRPFEAMPLDWVHAFGGEGFADNPHGKGIAALETEHGPVVPLPNVEDPREPLVGPEHRPAPVGYGAYEMTWPARFRYVGTDYGSRWLETLYPGPAADFDVRFYQAAPSDQQLDGLFAPGDRFVVEGMSRESALLEAVLSPLVVRAFVTQRRADALDVDGEGLGETVFVEIPTRPDTVHLFPNQATLAVIYRGVLEVAEDDADDIIHLMVAAEAPDHPKPLEHYERVLALRLDKDKGALASLKDEDLMPPGAEGWLAKPDYGDMQELTRLEQRAHKNMERGRKKKLAAARAELEGAGFDVADAFREEPLPEPPDPYDADAMMSFVEQMEKLSIDKEKELALQKAELEQAARASFAEAGFDYEAEQKRAEVGGPPEFSADEHLIMLHDMVRIAAEGGEPLEELERELTCPRYAQMLRELETRVRDAYASYAHLGPAAALPAEAERQLLRVRLEAAHCAGESMARERLIGADLHGLDLHGLDLAGALLEGADLSETDLSGADLSGAVLARCKLDRTNLSGANLSGANLGSCELRSTRLLGAKLSGTVLMRSRLEGVALCGAEIEGVDFIEVELVSADFSHVRAQSPLFLQIDLRGCSFVGAELAQARFVQTDLRGVDFTGARLPGVQLVQTLGDGARFVGAEMTRAVLVHETSFCQADFTGADLCDATLRKTPLCGSDFSGARLHRADLSGCDLRGARLSRIAARESLFLRARLEGADLRRADLLGALFTKADLAGADLSGANLSRADLALARLDGRTKVEGALELDARLVPKRKEQRA